jgi:hypothetical protein
MRKFAFSKLGMAVMAAAVSVFFLAGCAEDPADEGVSSNNAGNPSSSSNGGNPSGGDSSSGANNNSSSSVTSVSTEVTSDGTVLRGSNLAGKLAWLDRSAESHNTYIVEVDADESIAPHTFNYSGAINITVILRGDGTNRTIRLSRHGIMFTIRANVTVILDNNITLHGHSQNTGSMVYVNGGIFKMNDGAIITGNVESISKGGGVYVNSGTFEMNGGTISGNNAKDGAGVYIASGETFIMNGGTISDNNGRGVYLSYGKFTMNGGIISGNNGGGVYLNGGTFTMNDGTISGNNASDYGGGVYVRSGTFAKASGTITGYSDDQANGNAVKDAAGIISRKGHAVYVSDTRRKETTAGPDLTLSSSTNEGWDE